MNSRGGRSTARDVDRVSRSVRNVDRDSKRANRNLNIFSRSLTILGTRTVLITAALVVLGVVLTGLSPALLGAVAATVALGAVVLPIFGLAAVAALGFAENVDIVGSSAWELARAFGEFKAVVLAAAGPAIDALFGALVKVLAIIGPMVTELGPAFTVFATALSGAIVQGAQAFAQLTPMIDQLLRAAGPSLGLLGTALALLMADLLKIAIYGMPVLEQVLGWVVDFLKWLGPAIDDMDKFAHSALGVGLLTTTLTVFVETAKYVASVVSSLAGIAYQLFIALEPLLAILGGALLLALIGIRDALDWVNGNMGTMQYLILPLTAAALGLYAAWKAWLVLTKIAAALKIVNGLIIAARAGALGLTLAMYGLDVAMLPIFGWAALVLALAAAFYVAYTKVGWFHDAVNAVFTWVSQNWPLLLAILTGPIGLAVLFIVRRFNAIKSVVGAVARVAVAAFNTVRDAVQWVIDKVDALIDKVRDVGGAVKTGVDVALPGGSHGMFSDDGVLGIPGVPGLASGGRVVRGGTTIVGEDGAEALDLPPGATVTPLDEHGGGDVVIPITLEMDGQIVTQVVHRHTRKKRSTR